MSHIAFRATAHHQSCLPHTKVLGKCFLICKAPVLYRRTCRLHPKKDYNGPFLHLVHLPLSVTSESLVHYSLPQGRPSVCLWLSSWRAFILQYDQTPLGRADVAQPLKTFQRNSQLNFVVMFFSPSCGSRSLPPPMSPIRHSSN